MFLTAMALVKAVAWARVLSRSKDYSGTILFCLTTMALVKAITFGERAFPSGRRIMRDTRCTAARAERAGRETSAVARGIRVHHAVHQLYHGPSRASGARDYSCC